MLLVIILIYLNFVTGQSQVANLQPCLWSRYHAERVIKSPLSEYIGVIKSISERYETPVVDEFLCRKVNLRDWVCVLHIDKLSEYLDGADTMPITNVNLTVSQCGGTNSCVPVKTVRPPTSYECEDSYCINNCKHGVYPCTNSGVSPDESNSDDCLLKPKCFIDSHWNRTTDKEKCLPPGGCLNNSDCSDVQSCIYNRCSNPCFGHKCGVNTECKVTNQTPKCYCLNGTESSYRLQDVRRGLRGCQRVFSHRCTQLGVGCPENFTCFNEQCHTNCVNEENCFGNNETCHKGICRANCSSSIRHCRRTEVCRDGLCVRLPTSGFQNCSGTDGYGNAWSVPQDVVGEQACPSGSTGTVTWACGKDGKFTTQVPNYSRCKSLWVDILVAEADTVRTLNDTYAFLDKLVNDTASPNKTSLLYFGTEIPRIINATIKAMQASNKNTTSYEKLYPLVKKSIQSLDNLLASKQEWGQLPQNERSSVLTELIGTIESTAILLVPKIEPNKTDVDKETQVIHTPTTRVKLGSIHFEKNTTEATTTTINDSENESDSSKVVVDIIPNQNADTGKTRLKYVFVSMDAKTSKYLFPGMKENNKSLVDNHQAINGHVVSLTIVQSWENGTDSVVYNGTGNPSVDIIKNVSVEITFTHELNTWGKYGHDIRRKCDHEDIGAVLSSGSCVYWDVNKLHWSMDGCHLVQSTSTVTICKCNHLTSFAVLMDTHNCHGDDALLEILTIVLCTLSALALFLTWIAYTLVKSRLRERSIITKHLSFNLMLGNIFLIVLLDRDYFNLNSTFCSLTGVAAHFVFTHAFMWMAVEGWHLYGMLFRVARTPLMTIERYQIICLALSVVIVAVTFTTGWAMGGNAYGNDAVCWLNDDYIWGFNGPVGVILGMNFVILIATLRKSATIQKSKIRLNNDTNLVRPQGPQAPNRKWIKGGLCLTILLGVTWVFGYFMLFPGISGYVAAYIFTILCASQGVLIFVLYCVKDETIWEYFKKHLQSSRDSQFRLISRS